MAREKSFLNNEIKWSIKAKGLYIKIKVVRDPRIMIRFADLKTTNNKLSSQEAFQGRCGDQNK